MVCRYVPPPAPHRVGFLYRFGLKTGTHFAHFGLESGMVFGGTTGVYEGIYRLIFKLSYPIMIDSSNIMVNVEGLFPCCLYIMCWTRSRMCENNSKMLLKAEISSEILQRYYFDWKRQKPFAQGTIY